MGNSASNAAKPGAADKHHGDGRVARFTSVVNCARQALNLSLHEFAIRVGFSEPVARRFEGGLRLLYGGAAWVSKGSLQGMGRG